MDEKMKNYGVKKVSLFNKEHEKEHGISITFADGKLRRIAPEMDFTFWV